MFELHVNEVRDPSVLAKDIAITKAVGDLRMEVALTEQLVRLVGQGKTKEMVKDAQKERLRKSVTQQMLSFVLG